MIKIIPLSQRHYAAAFSILFLFFPMISIFAQETFDKNKVTNLIHVPLTRQSTNYTCGVAAVQSVLAYYGDEIREDNLAKALDANSESGTNYLNIVEYAKSKGYEVVVYKEMTLEQLQKVISNGKPVICAIQAWTEKKPSDYDDDWADGHYVIVVGYDKDRIYIMDPSTHGNYTYIPTQEFLKRWHDVDQKGIKLVPFGIVMSKNKVLYNPNTVKYLE